MKYIPPSKAFFDRGNARAALLRELQRTNSGASNVSLLKIVDDTLPLSDAPWKHGADQCPYGHKKETNKRSHLWCRECGRASNRAYLRARRQERPTGGAGKERVSV